MCAKTLKRGRVRPAGSKKKHETEKKEEKPKGGCPGDRSSKGFKTERRVCVVLKKIKRQKTKKKSTVCIGRQEKKNKEKNQRVGEKNEETNTQKQKRWGVVGGGWVGCGGVGGGVGGGRGGV